MKIVLLVIVLLVELLTIRFWLVCNKLADFFHFSFFDLTLRLDEAAHNDIGVPIFVVRTFHNKTLGTFVDVYKNFLHFWDILFLVNFISIVGVIGIFFAVWYLFQKK